MDIRIGDKFRHFKGFIVTVKELAKHSETLEEMVVYEHDGEIWVRPKEMFCSDEDVSKRKDNVTGQKKRFERIDE